MGLPLGPAPADVVKQRGWTASISRRSALQDAAGRPYVSLQARCGSIGHAKRCILMSLKACVVGPSGRKQPFTSLLLARIATIVLVGAMRQCKEFIGFAMKHPGLLRLL